MALLLLLLFLLFGSLRFVVVKCLRGIGSVHLLFRNVEISAMSSLMFGDDEILGIIGVISIGNGCI